MTPEELSTIPRTLDDLLEHGSWGTQRLVLDQKPKTATGKFEVYSFELAKNSTSSKNPPGLPGHDVRLASACAPRTALAAAKAPAGPGRVRSGHRFHAAVLFYGFTGQNNPILVALHHRMRYANVFINEARARRLGLQEGDLVEIWMEAHPDEKQRAFLSVSK